jgi:hypothetical protein
MWGRWAGTFVEARAARLATAAAVESAASIPSRPSVRRYRPGLRRSFGPRHVDVDADVLDGSLAAVLGPGAQPPRWCWTEAPVDLHAAHSEIARSLRARDARAEVSSTSLVPRVDVEVRDGQGVWGPLVRDGRVENDEGRNVVVLAGAPHGDEICWCAYWMVPQGVDASATYRFAVARATSDRRCVQAGDCSPAFSVAGAPPSANCAAARR